jgi:hypothetical protein
MGTATYDLSVGGSVAPLGSCNQHLWDLVLQAHDVLGARDLMAFVAWVPKYMIFLRGVQWRLWELVLQAHNVSGARDLTALVPSVPKHTNCLQPLLQFPPGCVISSHSLNMTAQLLLPSPLQSSD